MIRKILLGLALVTLFFIFAFTDSATAQSLSTGDYISIARVEKDGKVGYVDGWGNEILPPEYDEGSYQYFENKITVRKGENWYIYDVQGNLLLDLKDKYRYVGYAGDGLFLVFKDGVRIDIRNGFHYDFDPTELTFIDISGEEKVRVRHCLYISQEFITSKRYQGGYLDLAATVYSGDKRMSLVGYADRSGEVVMRPKVYSSKSGNQFSEGLLFAANGSGYYEDPKSTTKYGFVDITGEWVIEPTYNWLSMSHFVDGAAIVDSALIENDPDYPNTLSNTFLINHEGQRIFPKAVHVKRNAEIMDSVVIVEKYFGEENRFALAKTDGTFITDFEYNFIEGYSNAGYYAMTQGSDYFYMDKSGSRVHPNLPRNERDATQEERIIGRAAAYRDGIAWVYYTEDRRTEIIDMNGETLMTTMKLGPMIEGGLVKVMLSHKNSPEGIRYGYYNRGQLVTFKDYDKMHKFQYLKL